MAEKEQVDKIERTGSLYHTAKKILEKSEKNKLGETKEGTEAIPEDMREKMKQLKSSLGEEALSIEFDSEKSSIIIKTRKRFPEKVVLDFGEEGLERKELIISDGKRKVPELMEEEKAGWEEMVDQWIEEKLIRQMEKMRRYNERMEKTGQLEKKVAVNYESAKKALRERLRKILPRAFEGLAVHWLSEKNKDHTDFDGVVCVELFKLAGLTTKSVLGKEIRKGFGGPGGKHEMEETYVPIKRFGHTERRAGFVHADTGQYPGVAFFRAVDEELSVVELSDKETLKKQKEKNFLFFHKMGMVIDHHPEGAPSAAGLVYKLLDKFGFFEGAELKYKERIRHKEGKKRTVEEIERTIKITKGKLERLVEFTDIVDSSAIQEIAKPENYKKAHRTMLGLHKFVQPIHLMKFILKDGDWNEPLTKKQLEDYGLIYKDEGLKKIVNRSEQKKRKLEKTEKKLEEMEKTGFIVDSEYGKMAIDIGGELLGSPETVYHASLGSLAWWEDQGSLYMFCGKELPEDLFPQGIRVHKHLWVVPPDQRPVNFTLREAIEEYIGSEIEKGSGLETALGAMEVLAEIKALIERAESRDESDGPGEISGQIEEKKKQFVELKARQIAMRRKAGGEGYEPEKIKKLLLDNEIESGKAEEFFKERDLKKAWGILRKELKRLSGKEKQ